MAAISVLAELVASLEKEATGLQAAAASASEKDLRAAANRSAGQLRVFRDRCAMAMVGGGAPAGQPASFLGYSDHQAPVYAGSQGDALGFKAPVPVARDLPAGTPEAFDKENLAAVITHMGRYEGSAVECGKALRALSSLAYKTASVGEDADALSQALRLLSLHPTEENVQINGMKFLGNVAYDPKAALERLSTPAVMGALISAMARKPASKEISSKASEAVARVVAAEVGPDRVGPPPPAERGPLRALFTVVEADDAAGREIVVELVKQLVNNEVATPDLLVQRIVDLAEPSKQTGPAAAAWLMLAKQIAMAEISSMSEGLISKGAIGAAASVMVAQNSHGPAQLAGIEAMSGLVGSRWIGLQAFAAVKGIERIEEAMAAHPDEAVLQTKGIRALASGIQWPEDIQTKASYNYRHGVKLTKEALAKHGGAEDLIVAGLEALGKYLDRVKCVEEVTQNGGADLIKTLVTRHISVDKVKNQGIVVLDAIGEKEWREKLLPLSAAKA